MKAIKQATHLILWEGPSRIDGAPVVVVGIQRNGKGVNAKTGAMLQTYILRADMAPIDAIRTGADASICGACPHRGASALAALSDPSVSIRYGDRSCYVNIGQGPRAVFDAFSRGRYARAASLDDVASMGRGRMVRLGTYGDPAAVPAEVWRALLSEASGRTGYTHQWRRADCAEFRDFVMASCDTEQDRADAVAAGWRTFRVRAAGAPMMAREFVCPASEEGGRKVECSQCLACDGAERARKGSPVIIAHGALARRFAANLALRVA